MRSYRSLSAIVALLLTGLAARAQDPGKLFRQATEGKTLFLRGFDGSAKVHWHWDGTTLVHDAPLFHEFTAIAVEKVKVSSTAVTLSGHQLAIAGGINDPANLLDLKEKVTIEVDLHGADAATLLPKLADLLFYSDLDTATTALPSRYVARMGHVSAKNRPATQGADCGCPRTTSVAADPPHKGRITPPKVTHTVDPEFSEDARRKKFSGNVMVGLIVDESGHPGDLWVLTPAGLGLDPKAAEAVSRYLFQPATRDGQPIATEIYIDVNFQIF